MHLAALYKRAIIHHEEYQAEPWLVPHSIPILYFGDLASYSRSALKIVTVGLNPSNVEFLEDRFRSHEIRPGCLADLERSLSQYFKYNPYRTWFDQGFETLLQPLSASYYGNKYAGNPPLWWNPQDNTALHTDMCTPLATHPTWSKLKLPRTVRIQLEETGFALWRDLIEVLKPDLILIFVGQSHLRKLGPLNWRCFSPFEQSEPRHHMRVASFGASKIVWGQSQVRPLLHLRTEVRPLAAKAILREAGLV
jgi:hypothetical protein